MEKTLKEILEYKELTLDDVLKIGIQLIDLLKIYHKKKIVHRDIRKENIIFNSKNNIFLIDFGLSCHYKSTYHNNYGKLTSSKEYREYIKSKGKNKFLGNLLFSSIYFHSGYDYYPKDDLISLSYLMLYLYYGQLPWSEFKFIDRENDMVKALKKYTNIHEYYKKFNSNKNKIFDGKKNPFLTLYTKFINLSYDSIINYEKYQLFLKSYMINKDDNIFSWSICE